ncbi:MAG: 2-phospho-L-lactate transferase [Gammaproteobacteria bacterium]
MEKYIAITGGVGGAKLCLGFAHLLTSEQMAFVVNTGDDFNHLGLHISPDLDTLMYTLGRLSNPDMGWGREHETWSFIAALKQLGGDSWFNLGDADLATHVMRTEMLAAESTLTEVTATLSRQLGIEHQLVPMSDDPVRTIVHTETGALAFQHYFVRERCVPAVTGFEFDGTEEAALSPQIHAWLDDPDLAGVVICPSNPFVSIDPILAIQEFAEWLRASPVPVVAVSPIVRGEAIKGPTAKMMKELSMPTTADAIAEHYQDFIDGFIIDQQDASLADRIAALNIETIAVQTVMVTLADRIELARTAIDFLRRLRRGE